MTTFRCGACQSISPNTGSGVRIYETKPTRVCNVCCDLYPIGAKSKKARLVGSSGKAQKVSSKNDGFTVGRYGVPLGTPDYVGHDVRTQCSPEEIAHIKKHGYYSSQWRQLRGQK